MLKSFLLRLMLHFFSIPGSCLPFIRSADVFKVCPARFAQHPLVWTTLLSTSHIFSVDAPSQNLDMVQVTEGGTTSSEKPWYEAYPPPRSEPLSIDRHDVLRLLKSDTAKNENFVLVDLRRNDFEAREIFRFC